MCRKLVILLLIACKSIAFAEVSFNDDIKPFIKEFCIRCHGPEKQKGDRRYDSLEADFESRDSVILWRDILDQLHLEEMPPKKPYPEQADRKKIIDWISANFKKVQDSQKVSKNGTVMRRLSHFEYTNSLKDLFKLDIPNLDLSHLLKPDNISHGFDTDAKQLKATPYLFSKYLEIADQFIEKSIPYKKPDTKKVVFRPQMMQNVRDSYVIKEGNKSLYLDIFGGVEEFSRSYLKHWRAPQDAWYKIKINAQAIAVDSNWKHYRSPKPGAPWKLKIIASNPEFGRIHKPNVSDYELETITVTESKKDHEVTVFLKKGFQVVLWWENGPSGLMGFRLMLNKQFKKGIYEDLLNKHGSKMEVFKALYNGPRLRVYQADINGPLYKVWPPAAVRQVFGENPPQEPTLEFAKKTLKDFAYKAWRRPPDNDEMELIFELVEKTLAQEGYRAIAKAMKSIICSPAFLYHYQNKGRLDNYALASRLSYFLWGTSPDDELLELAAKKELTDPQVYNQQVHRLLSDPKLSNMVRDFSSQWLHLKNATEMPPDEKMFRRYYSMNIADNMIQETEAFLKTLIDKNMSIYNCLDSDFLLINQTMAQYYGIKNVKGEKFRPVKLPKKNPRGGLLTQASVLTATSNGVDTSPIVRGVWVLENILGITPPPPPADVEPLEPDIRGAKTVKQRLMAHREKESCNECHRKIDYLGMTLESFDPSGLQRTHYDEKRKLIVDPTAVAPNGKQLAGADHLKNYLLERKHLFARALTSKLLAYGTGRSMSYIERPEIDQIVEFLESKSGFQDLLVRIVNSEIFLNK